MNALLNEYEQSKDKSLEKQLTLSANLSECFALMGNSYAKLSDFKQFMLEDYDYPIPDVALEKLEDEDMCFKELAENISKDWNIMKEKWQADVLSFKNNYPMKDIQVSQSKSVDSIPRTTSVSQSLKYNNNNNIQQKAKSQVLFNEKQEEPPKFTGFITASEKLAEDEAMKGNQKDPSKRTLGLRRRAPDIGNKRPRQEEQSKPKASGEDAYTITDVNGVPLDDPRLRNLDPALIEKIVNEILDRSPAVSWNDIAGLEHAKKCITEAIIWPLLRPDIFTGIRGPPKGIILFGPPGTGKTLIGKAIASQSNSTFFNISASALTSKWIGVGEKMVRALFSVARCYPKSVIFIDEVDSVLTQRSENENDAMRRLKNEILVQIDGAGSEYDERILVVGATNRPQEIDDAARRRFVKRLYIGLPELKARKELISSLMTKSGIACDLSPEDMNKLAVTTKGYSGSDLKALCTEAAFGPCREVSDIINVDKEKMRSNGMSQIRASVIPSDLNAYIEWNKTFGSFSMSIDID